MTLILFGLKNCDTCRKAVKALEVAGKSVTFMDIRGGETTPAHIKQWESVLGWEALLNTRSTTWRGLDADQKIDMDTGKALALMTQHRALIKRPLIEAGDTLYLGWKADVQTALL